MLGSLILYLKGMRIMMFQLSGFYCSCRVQKPQKVYTFGFIVGVGNIKGLGFRDYPKKCKVYPLSYYCYNSESVCFFNVGGCQNYGPLLNPEYSAAPDI